MDIDDLVDIKSDSYLPKGRTKPIKDDHDITPGQYTIREIFEKSSNVGVATLVRNTYPDIKDEQEFTTRLGKMNLDKVTGVDLHGEVEPVFRHAVQDNMWSRGSLEMVAIGYETEYTPLQILTFYNAVANDGKMMKPQILEAVRSHGVVVETIAPEVLNSSICNSATIKKVHELLKGVVQNGTANRIKSPYYEIAGKTGTAQIYENDKLVGHSASFAGFFPADHPKYSCIVVVTSPKNGNVYGSSLAAPVFKKIADKLYASDRDLHAGKNFDIASLPDNKKVLPTFKDGDRSILDRLFSEFNVTVGNLDNSQSLFVTTTNENGVVMLEPVSTRKAVVPNVVGMGLRDAMYLLRMKHLKVTVVGRGVVKKQSIPANTDIKGGEKITIELAIN
jgi:cell division protein FtsI (penicillin-binding protein 3)